MSGECEDRCCSHNNIYMRGTCCHTVCVLNGVGRNSERNDEVRHTPEKAIWETDTQASTGGTCCVTFTYPESEATGNFQVRNDMYVTWLVLVVNSHTLTSGMCSWRRQLRHLTQERIPQYLIRPSLIPVVNPQPVIFHRRAIPTRVPWHHHRMVRPFLLRWICHHLRMVRPRLRPRIRHLNRKLIAKHHRPLTSE